MLKKRPYKPGAPFNDENADVVLRSFDRIERRIHKIFLTSASPVFADILGMPGTPRTSGPTHTPTGVLICEVSVDETSAIVTGILRFCHPAASPPVVRTVSDACDLYIAADKFQIDEMMVWTKQQIRSFIAKHPVAGYSMACSQDWKDMEREAARKALSHWLEDLVGRQYQVFRRVSAHTLPGLWQYHMEASKILGSAVDSHFVMQRATVWTLQQDLFN